MHSSNTINPHLVDFDIKTCAERTLQKCRAYKDKYYMMMCNVAIVIGVIGAIGLFVAFRLLFKETDEDKRTKEEQKRQLILSKIHQFRSDRESSKAGMLTGLPSWSV